MQGAVPVPPEPLPANPQLCRGVRVTSPSAPAVSPKGCERSQGHPALAQPHLLRAPLAAPAQPRAAGGVPAAGTPLQGAIPEGRRDVLPALPSAREGGVLPCVAEPAGKGMLLLSSNLPEDGVMYSPVTNLEAAMGLFSHLQHSGSD